MSAESDNWASTGACRDRNNVNVQKLHRQAMQSHPSSFSRQKENVMKIMKMMEMYSQKSHITSSSHHIPSIYLRLRSNLNICTNCFCCFSRFNAKYLSLQLRYGSLWPRKCFASSESPRRQTHRRNPQRRGDHTSQGTASVHTGRAVSRARQNIMLQIR